MYTICRQYQFTVISKKSINLKNLCEFIIKNILIILISKIPSQLVAVRLRRQTWMRVMARRTWFDSRPSQNRFIKSQVRVGLGILTDLNWHLPSNITIMINTPSQLKGETCMVYYFYKSQDDYRYVIVIFSIYYLKHLK